MSIEIENIIDGFYNHIDDINNIQCVDDLMESLHEYLITINADRDLNVCNILSIDEIDDVDDYFNAPYDDDEAMDLKIETIDNCIRLMMTDRDTSYSAIADEE